MRNLNLHEKAPQIFQPKIIVNNIDFNKTFTKDVVNFELLTLGHLLMQYLPKSGPEV